MLRWGASGDRDAFTSGRASVLVVEDEPTIAEVVARYLQRAGYETRTAHDGPAAVAAAISRRPDLVVLDIMLPGFDGIEVMRRLHADLEGRVTVILLTAKGEESDRVVGLRAAPTTTRSSRSHPPSWWRARTRSSAAPATTTRGTVSG